MYLNEEMKTDIDVHTQILTFENQALSCEDSQQNQTNKHIVLTNINFVYRNHFDVTL